MPPAPERQTESSRDPLADDLAAGARTSFLYHKQLAEKAVAQLPDDKLHVPLDENTNSVAVVMKHVAGNLLSRFTDFLTSDGEKPWRNRDDEFVDTFTSRRELLDYWQRGWTCLLNALDELTPQDFARDVAIRGQPHSVPQAICRALAHCSYHVGQIVLIARIHAGEQWQTLTIARGQSAEHNRRNWGTRQYGGGER
jgi:uncharacterized damage-inducible protein DinB